MNDDEIRSRSGGRGTVEMRGEAAVRARAEMIGHVLGYRLVSTGHPQRPGIGPGPFTPAYRRPADVRLLFQRDDDPQARRRAERAVERLRAGGPLMPAAEPPPPGLPRPSPGG